MELELAATSVEGVVLVELPALNLEHGVEVKHFTLQWTALWHCSSTDWPESCLFLCCHLDSHLARIQTETELWSNLKVDEWMGQLNFHVPSTLPKWLAVSCCGGNNRAAKTSDEVFKLKTSVDVEKWFCRQYSLVVWVIWLYTIHGGKRGNESNRGKEETQRG